MRRKHVLMTTALMALFTACSNEDILESAQNNVNGVVDAQRPTVDNVILSLLDDAPESRLGFGGNGYLWETGDVLGALLMDDWNDNVLQGKRPSTVSEEEWNDYTWTQRYILSDQIHTDYPFTRQEDGTWTTNAKMQEGNYFFAFPFKTYEGKREAMHDLSEQEQDGVTQEALQEAYAKNNFFIGYSRIHAGTAEADVINANIKMTPVLGAVGITVKNVGTGKFTVEKIVLESQSFSTVIKVDPTKAEYKGEDKTGDYNIKVVTSDNGTGAWWPLTDASTDENNNNSYFNYANYEEMTFDGSSWAYNDTFTERYKLNEALVNNTEKSDNYNRDNALRAVINPVKDTDHRVELTVKNSPVLESQESANFIVMTNIYEYNAEKENTITAKIYTDRGIVDGVVISNVKDEATGYNGVTVISENPIVRIAPDEVNKVTLEIDDNSVQAPETMAIYNEADLKQFIEWNKGMRRMYTATLMNDITLTKDMSDMLTAADWANATLNIKNVEGGKKVLTIAKDAANNILDYVMVYGTVAVENNLTLGSNSYVSGTYKKLTGVSGDQTITNSIKIAEGASVTVKSAIESLTTGNQQNKSLNIAENKGTFTIDADVDKLTFNNESKMTVNAEVTLDKDSDSKNNMKGELTIGENGRLNCGGKLTNTGGKIGGIETYAVINNNGQIYNLENGSLGKVIVGEKATVTNVDSNAGIIDISSNIETDLNTKVGTIAYTVASGKSVSMAAVNKAGITELTVNGGSVTAATDDDKIDAPSVEKVIVTENGGTVGGEKVSAFSAAAFEINGDATLQNLTIGNNVEVKAGTTTIKGTVTAGTNPATEPVYKNIILASYDGEKYVSHDATLFVPTSSDQLAASAIYTASGSKVGKAYVNNQGTINLVNRSTSNVTKWTGNQPGAAIKTTVVNPTINNESDLQQLIDDVKANKKEIDSEIIIQTGTIDFKNINDADVFASLAKGKKVIVDGAKLWNINSTFGMEFGDLVVKGDVVIGSGDDANTGITFLKVKSFDYTEATSLAINKGYIQVDGSAQIGTTTGVASTSSITNSGNGQLVTKDMESSAGALIKWDFTNKKWEALN